LGKAFNIFADALGLYEKRLIKAVIDKVFKNFEEEEASNTYKEQHIGSTII